MSTATVRVNIQKPQGSGQRTGWWKEVSGLDRSKRGGWCILGDFVNEGEQDFQVGSVLIRCAPAGSARHGWKATRVYSVTPDGLLVVKGEGCDEDGDFDLHKQTPSLLDTIELAMDSRRVDPDQVDNPLAPFTNEELVAELVRRGVALNGLKAPAPKATPDVKPPKASESTDKPAPKVVDPLEEECPF